ncbi:unnamed protein product [Prorocentrum cordatum]|uniref:Ig-like domain-containing protein n=1 Tax=Prorocentrum cordatum TaxID=2364126 RepID=A0ABN9V0G0_9DINO|nr:unnamed protein product [Polarella glacialis]
MWETVHMLASGHRGLPLQQRVRLLLLLAGAVPAMAKKSKGLEILKHYPTMFKFCMFWWCIFVFAVMGGYIIDTLLFRKFGPARISWKMEHVFRGTADRDAYWAQLVDPSRWSTTHPVLQSADLRMVDCSKLLKEVAAGAAVVTDTDEVASYGDEDKPPKVMEASSSLESVALGPLRPGLGLVLRHKGGTGALAGAFYCTRACTLLEKPPEGVWRFGMDTVEAGAGYPYAAGSQKDELEMWPPGEDGSIRCRMSGTAEVGSRFFRWWSGVESSSRAGALAMLEAIGEEIQAAKKHK